VTIWHSPFVGPAAEIVKGRRPRSARQLGTFGIGLRYRAMLDNTTDRSPRVLTPEQRKARDAARRAEAEQAMRDHEASQKAFYANRERLRAERLAREGGK
jgi:hypothetical protein